MKRSLIDLNRAGMPLIEIVFEPDLADGYEAASLIEELMLILKAVDSCSCKIAGINIFGRRIKQVDSWQIRHSSNCSIVTVLEGALRVDANVSARQKGSNTLGIRTEVKNIAGVNNVLKAVNFEVERQILMSKYNKVIMNETRAWDAELNRTMGMRDKEVEQVECCTVRSFIL